MSHPNRKEGIEGHNAKLRRMTRDYGAADPAMVKAGPDTKYKQEGPEEAVGFGADSAAPKARGDRPARKTVAANPLATYALGGSVISRAGGGRTRKAKGATNVNVIVSPGNTATQPQMPPPVIPPPGPPGGPPMGAPPGGPPMGGAPMGGPPPAPLMGPPLPPPGALPGGMPPRAKGGRVEMDAGALSGEGRLEKEAIQKRKGKHNTGPVTG